MDIQSFDGGKRRQNDQYINCFILFSSMFKGHFIGSILKGKKAKTERILLSLIRRYKRDAMLESEEVKDEEAPQFSFFVEQLFKNLLSKFKSRRSKHVYVIQSDYMLLSDEIRNELMLLPVDSRRQNLIKLKVSPFLLSLKCRAKDIIFMEEFIWAMDEKELNDFKQCPLGHKMYSHQEFRCKVGKMGYATLKLYLGRKQADSEHTGFGFKIIETSFRSIFGGFSVDIQEVGWYKNGRYFNNVGEGRHQGIKSAFKESLLNQIDGMNIRIALYFEYYK